MKNDIKSIAEELFLAMGFDVAVGVELRGDYFEISVVSGEADFLIGSRGRNLQDIFQVLRALLRIRLGEKILFTLDVNGYLRRKEETLREIARAVAERVRRSRYSLTLKPMPARERRVIHLELASFPDIVTESIGVEPERRMVVKPYP